MEYATSGIRVNAVSPGPVVTDLGATSLANEPDFPPLAMAGAPDIAAEGEEAVTLDAIDDLEQRLFMNALPMDVAYPIMWLASDEAAAVTGVDLPVDGGFSIKGIASVAAGSDPAKASQMCEPQ